MPEVDEIRKLTEGLALFLAKGNPQSPGKADVQPPLSLEDQSNIQLPLPTSPDHPTLNSDKSKEEAEAAAINPWEGLEGYIQQASVEARREQAESLLNSYAETRLSDRPSEWLDPKTIEAKLANPVPETATERLIRSDMFKRWDMIGERINLLRAKNQNDFSAILRESLWDIYTSPSKPTKIDSIVYIYRITLLAYESYKHNVSEDVYIFCFFENLIKSIFQCRDEHHNTLINYIIICNRSCISHVPLWIKGMSIAMRRHGSPQEEIYNTLCRTLIEEKNPFNRNLLELVSLQGGRSATHSCLIALEAARHLPTDPLAPAPELRGKEKTEQFQSATALPFNLNLLEKFQNESPLWAGLYVRAHIESITPEIISIAHERGQDLFATDLKAETSPQAEIRSFSGVNGVLANAYAKSGMFSIPHAYCRLVRDKGRRSQGYRDKRGYNIYMQIAEQHRPNPAFLQNEHEFWDHILYQIAKYQHRQEKSKANLEDVLLRVRRRVLDMPGDDGRTALHLAARSGNIEVARYLLDRLLDFRHAENLRTAMRISDHRTIVRVKKLYYREMRTNLSYLLAVDNDHYNSWMHAIECNQKEILISLVSHVEPYSGYLDIISLIPIQPKGMNAMSLSDFVEDHILNSHTPSSSEGDDAGLYICSVLRAARQRSLARR